MEGGTVKSGEEYEGSDDLRQENENAHAVRSLPPTSVAPPTQSTSENPGIEAHHIFFLYIYWLPSF